MASPEGIARRRFLKLCSSLLALAHSPEGWTRPSPAASVRFKPARLVTTRKTPFRLDDLHPNAAHIFHYPYVSTPCFLIDLKRPVRAVELHTEQGQPYVTPNGVGPNRSIVAFSAICAHRMAHPVRAVSFINYRADEVAFIDHDERPARQAGVIKCCSERSVYDARRGGAVLGGPAPQPLAAIALEYDAASDTLTAVGASGGLLFDRYLREFHDRLVLEYRTDSIERSVGAQTVVSAMDDYCRNQVIC